MASDILLEVSEVDQVFRIGFWMKRVQVLHGVSFSVPSRSVFGFLGPNGAGKTTLIQLIVGLRKPPRGSIRIAGVEADSREARSRIGYLPERPYFYEHLTGEGFLHYFGALSGMSRAKVVDRIPKVLSDVGMSHARKLELKRYSKGMLQRIGIAQAILHDPEFLVLDEPMSGLDPIGRREMRELILRLAAEGRTIFFSSHVIPDVEALCNQVGIIQKGRLIGCGPIEHFLTEGSTQSEITFGGITLEAAKVYQELTHLRKVPEGLRGTVHSQEAVDQVLGRILGAGGHVLGVTPVRRSLEDIFERESSQNSVEVLKQGKCEYHD